MKNIKLPGADVYVTIKSFGNLKPQMNADGCYPCVLTALKKKSRERPPDEGAELIAGEKRAAIHEAPQIL